METNTDWTVYAICDTEQRNDPECVIEYRTIGFSKYGKGEIVVIGKVKNQNKIKNLINTFGRMLASGEKFENRYTHHIDDIYSNNEFSFGVVYGQYDDEEEWIQLMPDFEIDSYTESYEDIAESGAEEQIIYINNRAYVTLEKDKKMNLCRIDKLVWQSFVDNTLDIFDDSWELDYKDGNYKNCALDNLYRVK